MANAQGTKKTSHNKGRNCNLPPQPLSSSAPEGQPLNLRLSRRHKTSFILFWLTLMTLLFKERPPEAQEFWSHGNSTCIFQIVHELVVHSILLTHTQLSRHLKKNV